MVDLSWAFALLPLAGAGFGVGFLVGLTGVGGGALMTPLLISTFGVSPATAVGTDLLYASVTKTVGGWRHHVAENVDWPIVIRLAMGSIPASIILLAVMSYMPFDTAAMAHWIRYGLAFALPILPALPLLADGGSHVVLLVRCLRGGRLVAQRPPPGMSLRCGRR